MTFFSRVDIGGNTNISNAEYIGVNAQQDSVSDCTINFPNDKGSYSGTFAIGNIINIWVGSPATQDKIFNGVVTDLSYTSLPNQREFITVQGHDMTKRLRDVTANDLYVGLSAGSIVKSIISAETSGITTNNVDDGATLNNIQFKKRPVIDCIGELAELSGYDWWIDSGADLHFVSRNSISSGKQLLAGSLGNITNSIWSVSDRELTNSVVVYGGRRVVAQVGSFGTAGTGSVFTLDDKPYDTKVKVNGVIKEGGILQQFGTPPTGIQYLVDFDNKQIIFTSGTEAGNNIPSSGTNVVTVDYNKQVPVVKLAEDRISIDKYGKKEKVIVNEEIKDPRQARDIALAEIQDFSTPGLNGQFNVKGINMIQPGHTVDVYIPYTAASGTMKVTNVSYNINQNTLKSEQILSLQAGTRKGNISDAFADYMISQRQLQAEKIDVSDIL